MNGNLLCEIRSYSENAYEHNHLYSQLILPLEGKLNIKTNDYKIKLDDEHLFYLPPKSNHIYHANSMNKFLVVDIPNDISSFLANNILKNEQHQIIDDRWKSIRSLLLNEAKTANTNSLNHLINYACSFLLEETKPKSVEYIHNNFHKKISIKELAIIENFNENHYIEWFNKKIGMTPNIYIQKLRLKKAKEYLLQTDFSLLMIAQLIGYKQQSSLTRLFKNHNEIAPNLYRKMFRK
ncbi:MAG: AraC family transcriptional regulator [Peptostreptococcaceae bacterium]|jgi:AraC-like DNA-binding protein|nr:AraC family transcriptional regulator [Peptostreptococcaceae bacterium]